MAQATKKTIKNPKEHAPSKKKRASNTQARKRKLTRRLKRRVDKQQKRQVKLRPAWKILGSSIKHLWRHKRVFIGILLVYMVLNTILVKGIAGNFRLNGIKVALDSALGGELGTWGTTFTLFGLLIGSAGSSASDIGGVFQVFLVITVSLAIVWALRSTYGKPVKITIRDTFYKGMYPLVPLILVLLVLILQLLPLLIGTSIYSVVQNGSIAASLGEQIVWFIFLIICVFASFYMLSGSIFAIYIVTLPNMKPLKALKASRKLTKFRRFAIMRKIVFLPLVIALISCMVLIPLIVVSPLAAEIVYMIGTVILLAVLHSYGYALYRELL